MHNTQRSGTRERQHLAANTGCVKPPMRYPIRFNSIKWYILDIILWLTKLSALISAEGKENWSQRKPVFVDHSLSVIESMWHIYSSGVSWYEFARFPTTGKLGAATIVLSYSSLRPASRQLYITFNHCIIQEYITLTIGGA